MNNRELSPLDRLIVQFDGALRATTGTMGTTARPSPGAKIEPVELNPTSRQRSASVMRVNHCGEVCAQALYQGQTLAARSPDVEQRMKDAAREEEDHLAWCETRIKELDSHVSYLNPFWYTTSFALGAATGLLGDKISLGFVAATEEGVCKHLDDYMDRLPSEDVRSREILAQMRTDESQHATNALAAGGTRFPQPIKRLMHRVSGLMTGSAWWI
ncbi:MAG: 2-polyprenyl-3-methyl-6-methoxy-1,4-benzoquinone monooxygenase [Pseudomonadales bacterium]